MPWPLVEHLERLAVVAAAAARLARDEDVGQEVHLHPAHAVALAGLAAASLHVEGEAPGPVAPRARLGHQAEELADEAEGAGVGRRVRARACGRSGSGRSRSPCRSLPRPRAPRWRPGSGAARYSGGPAPGGERPRRGSTCRSPRRPSPRSALRGGSSTSRSRRLCARAPEHAEPRRGPAGEWRAPAPGARRGGSGR